MNIDFTVTLIITVINIILAGIIIKNNIKIRSNQFFLLFLVFLILWKVTLFLYLTSSSETYLLLIGRVNFAVSTLMVFFAFKFSEAFAGIENVLISQKLIKNLLNLFTSLLVVITLFTSLISENEIIVRNEKQTIFGELYWLYFLHLIIFLIITIASLYKKSRFTKGYTKEQAKLILWGFLFAAIFGMTTNIVLPYIFNVFSLQEIGPLGTITITIAVTISIVRYRFLDTRVIIAKIIHIFIMSSFTFGLFFIQSYVFMKVFGSLFINNVYLLVLFTSLFFVLSYEFLNNLIQEKIESPLIYGKVKPEEIISLLNLKMSSDIDLNKIMLTTNKIIKDYWDNDDTFVAIKTSKGIEVYPEYNYNVDFEKIFKILHEQSNDIVLLEPPFKDFLNDIKKFTTREELDNIFNFINEKKLRLIVPLYFSKELTGAILMGEKRNDVYNTADSEVLKNIASLIGLSVNRARLFEEVQKFNLTLQSKVNEATAELQRKNVVLQEQLRKEKDMMDILGHELRTPLSIARNAILMLQTSLTRSEKISPETDSLINKATENIRREVKILETVLSSTRIENNRLVINFEKVEVNDVINDSLEGNKSEAEKKGLKIHTELPSEKLYAKAGREQIQEIVDNLVSNAIKYTEKGEIVIKAYQEKDLIVIDVIDTGEGIPENEIPNLGKKFYRINPYLEGEATNQKIIRPGGTGIGLYVVFNLVRMMNGEIKISSELGKGSTFSIRLPSHP